MLKRYKQAISQSTANLIKAAEEENPNWNQVLACLALGADANAQITVKKQIVNIILYASSHQAFDVVEELVKKGADVDCLIADPESDHYGCSPAWFAASCEEWCLLDLILAKSKKRLNQPAKGKDYKGTTVIWWCAHHLEFKLARDILNLGANPYIWGQFRTSRFLYEGNVATILADTPKYKFLNENIDKWDMILGLFTDNAHVYTASQNKYSVNYKHSILSYAVKDLRFDVVTKLCSKYNRTIFPESNIELLFLLVEQTIDAGFYEEVTQSLKKLIKLLLDGGSIEALRNANGDSLLHHALSKDNKIMIDFLVACWPQLVLEKNRLQQNCLFYALNSDYSVLSDLLNSNNLDVNELDIYGNSVLYYATEMGVEQDIRLLLSENAKCIRNKKETKSRLHFVVAYQVLINQDVSAITINQTDEEWRTALHYSIGLKNDFVSEFFLKNGANPNLQDRYGYSPAHNAILKGNITLLQLMHDVDLNQKNSLGVSAYVMACYSQNTEVRNLVFNNSKYTRTKVDKLLTKRMNFLEIKNDCLPKLKSLEESLVFLAAMRAIHDKNLQCHGVIDEALKIVFAKYFPKTKHKYPAGRAFGIELEFAHMPSYPLIPFDDLRNWFKLESQFDGSVNISSFMQEFIDAQELTSEVIDSPLKMEKFLTACKYLHASGAKVNYSTGFHVHVNINGGGEIGYIDDCLTIPKKNRTAVRFTIVKQILLNWAQIEPMLCSVLRNGRHFAQGSDYIAIQPHIDQILVCKNIEELQKLFNCYNVSQTLSVLSLNSDFKTFRTKHGTLEFRFHQGTVDPILISAWANLVSRLVDISVQQVKNNLKNHNVNKLLPYAGIEHLVYMLLAERRYQDTWDKEWGAPLCNYDAASDTNIQSKMQIAPLYLAYQAKAASHNEEKFKLNKHERQDLQTMLDLRTKYLKM